MNRNRRYHLARTLAVCMSVVGIVLGVGLTVAGAMLNVWPAIPLGFVFSCLGLLTLWHAMEC